LRDVSEKFETLRKAKAQAILTAKPETIEKIKRNFE